MIRISEWYASMCSDRTSGASRDFDWLAFEGGTMPTKSKFDNIVGWIW